MLTTVGADGIPHSVCKGIVKMSARGEVYLLDLYRGKTYRNLTLNPRMSITVVDEHRFQGYCLKGRGRIVRAERMGPHIMREWQKKMHSRITQRIIRSVRGDKGHPRHPEALLPAPKYLIVMEVREIVDLTPGHIK
jgi:hypothetical protein